MFEDMIIPCLKTCLHNVLYLNFLETYLYYVSRYFYTMYEDMFTQRHPVNGTFSKCLMSYSFKIDQIVLVDENGQWMKIRNNLVQKASKLTMIF